MSVFFITLNQESNDYPRCVGFYLNLDDAIRAICKNPQKYNLFDDCYDLAIIEEMQENKLFPRVIKHYLYKYNGKQYILQGSGDGCHEKYSGNDIG